MNWKPHLLTLLLLAPGSAFATPEVFMTADPQARRVLMLVEHGQVASTATLSDLEDLLTSPPADLAKLAPLALLWTDRLAAVDATRVREAWAHAPEFDADAGPLLMDGEDRVPTVPGDILDRLVDEARQDPEAGFAGWVRDAKESLCQGHPEDDLSPLCTLPSDADEGAVLGAASELGDDACLNIGLVQDPDLNAAAEACVDSMAEPGDLSGSAPSETRTIDGIKNPVIIAAGIAFAGAVVTQWWLDKRQEDQQAHDRQMAREARELEERRAASAAAAGGSCCTCSDTCPPEPTSSEDPDAGEPSGGTEDSPEAGGLRPVVATTLECGHYEDLYMDLTARSRETLQPEPIDPRKSRPTEEGGGGAAVPMAEVCGVDSTTLRTQTAECELVDCRASGDLADGQSPTETCCGTYHEIRGVERAMCARASLCEVDDMTCCSEDLGRGPPPPRPPSPLEDIIGVQEEPRDTQPPPKERAPRERGPRERRPQGGERESRPRP